MNRDSVISGFEATGTVLRIFDIMEKWKQVFSSSYLKLIMSSY